MGFPQNKWLTDLVSGWDAVDKNRLSCFCLQSNPSPPQSKGSTVTTLRELEVKRKKCYKTHKMLVVTDQNLTPSEPKCYEVQ